MKSIATEVKDLSNKLYTQINNVKLYKILSDFKGTYIEKQMQREESIVDPIFRVFVPFKPERQRNININPENNFDPYVDSLMDYPTIIGHKMKKPWKLFNRLISIQVPNCINECWHCYLPNNLFKNKSIEERSTELSAREIINKFYSQKKMDALSGKATNVLRITGGEPFELPHLILECLEILKEDKELNFQNVEVLKDEISNNNIEEYKNIFIWTETNITPFISSQGECAFMDSEDNIRILQGLSMHNNFLVHPCFHGLDANEYKSITTCKNEVSLNQLIDALKKFNNPNKDIKIDIYPTFGSNVCNPKNITNLFNKLYKIDRQLPLRTALVEYKTDYDPIKDRLSTNREVEIYSKFINLRIWNQLLQEKYGIGYGTLPRHLKLSNNISTSEDLESKVYSDAIYLFKGSFRDLYHREVLDILSLPKDHYYEMEYEEKWVQEDFYNQIKYKTDYFNNKYGIFTYVDKITGKIFPLRRFEILNSSTVGSILKINIRFLDYVNIDSSKGNSDPNFVMQEILSKYFGNKILPPSPTGKYLIFGESFFDNEKLNFSEFSNSSLDIKLDKGFEGFRKNIDSLVGSSFMRDSLFFHVNPIDMDKVLDDRNFINYYEIKAKSSFIIKLETYLPNYSYFETMSIEERDIQISISKDSIELMNNDIYNCPKYGTKNLEFKSKKVNKEEIVIIKFHSIHREFKCPNVEIRIRIKPLRMREAVTTWSISIFLLLWLSYGSLLANYDASGGVGPLLSIWNNIYDSSNTPALNVPFILHILFWSVGLLGIAYLHRKYDLQNNPFTTGVSKIK